MAYGGEDITKSIRCTTLGAFVLAFLFMLSMVSVIPIQSTHATGPTGPSSKVAYVVDSSCVPSGYVGSPSEGYADTTFPGCSIFTNAVSPGTVPAGGVFVTTGSNTVTFTNVPVSTINAEGVSALTGYDTVMLYEVCDIGSAANVNLVTAINTYLSTGMGKVIIYDGDDCAPEPGGTPNYSTFLFPFTTSNPGPEGLYGTVTFVESESSPATLTRGLTTGYYDTTDAIGDSNTFTSNSGGWCSAVQGTNGYDITGNQIAYHTTSAGGLAIYVGNDVWFTYGPNPWDTAVFNNVLDQPINPSGLACSTPITPTGTPQFGMPMLVVAISMIGLAFLAKKKLNLSSKAL